MDKLISGILICVGLIVGIFLYSNVLPVNPIQQIEQNKSIINFAIYDAPYGKLIIASNISDTPQNITRYRVIPQENDMIDYWNGNLEYTGNITTEVEAPQVALKILNNYGGLPEGAGPLEAHTEYIETYNTKTGQIVERIPDTTVINCQRSLDGKPVIGGYIRMELGSNGELYILKKVWRTVTPAGTIQVISPSEALQKILRGEILNVDRPKCTCDLTVDKVILAYRENGINQTQDYLEPVWDFKGTLSNGDSYRYLVSAESTPTTASNSRVTRDYLITEIPPDELPPDNIQDADNNPNTTGITPDNQSNTLPKGNHS